MTKPKIKVDIVSDVVCPWCYIGKRRIEKAMETLKDTYDFEVTYHPFELNPDIPSEGLNQKKYLAEKFGGSDRYEKITRHVSNLAAEEGLQFDFDKQDVSPNTRNAHRIIQFAKTEGKQIQVKEALMSAYFERGIDLSKKENLISVATSIGLDGERIEKLLSSEEGTADVITREKEMQQLGITGVPFYIINNKFGVSGAQPTETFMQVFSEANLAEEEKQA